MAVQAATIPLLLYEQHPNSHPSPGRPGLVAPGRADRVFHHPHVMGERDRLLVQHFATSTISVAAGREVYPRVRLRCGQSEQELAGAQIGLTRPSRSMFK